MFNRKLSKIKLRVFQESFQSLRGFRCEMSKVKKRSMEEELNGCLTVFEAMGLQYFSLKSLTWKNLKERPSVCRTIYMILVLCVITLMTVLFILKDQALMRDSMSSKNVLMFIVQHSMNVAMIIVLFTSLLQSFFSTRSIKKIYFNMKQIAVICLQEFRIELDFERIKKETWIKYSTMLSFLTIIHVVLALNTGQSIDDVLHLAFGIVPLLFLNTVVFKFVFYVGIINNQLEFMIKLLDDIFKYRPIRIIDNINYHLTTVKPAKTPEDPMKKLRAVWKIYNIVYDNGLLVNRSFGLTLLAMLGSLVILLTISGYQAFVIMIGELPAGRTLGKSRLFY